MLTKFGVYRKVYQSDSKKKILLYDEKEQNFSLTRKWKNSAFLTNIENIMSLPNLS